MTQPATGREPDLLTITEAADLLRAPVATLRYWRHLGTGQRFVRRLISERRIPYVKLGKHVRLERCALDAFVAAGRVPCR